MARTDLMQHVCNMITELNPLVARCIRYSFCMYSILKLAIPKDVKGLVSTFCALILYFLIYALCDTHVK